MPVRILLIGNGAREHAIAEALSRSPQHPRIYSYMGTKNPGIVKNSWKSYTGKYDNLKGIVNIAGKEKFDFAIIGPEAPLAFGVVDSLKKIDIPSVGPEKSLARLETSKSFTRLLMEKYRIPGLPRFRVFESMSGVKKFIRDLGDYVVKPDGLTGGKGVKVSGEHLLSIEDGVRYCNEVLKSHPSVIVEEKLVGEEFSLQSFTDGRHVMDTPPAQDHKRAFNGDRGPNTGGMGSYSCADHSLPFLKDIDLEQAHGITVKMADAMFKETGRLYRGVMYGGFILTADGVKLIEYNTRLGDPEAMNVLPIMRNDFVDVCFGIVQGNLRKIRPDFSEQATVCKYVAPRGYPSNPAKGEKIDVFKPGRSSIYYASVEERDGVLEMLGSRALAFVGISPDIGIAEQIAQQGIDSVRGPIFFRSDIGTKALIEKRISHMARLLSDSV
jgi:phosphoribosylamine--glycine ligase